MSLEALRKTNPDLLTPGMVKATLGNLGLSSADKLAQAESLGSDANALAPAPVPGSVSLDMIPGSETRQSFEHFLSSTERLFARIGITPPDVDTIVNSGIDFVYLGHEYQHMKTEGLEPRLVLAPYGLTVDHWKELYKKLEDDPIVNPIPASGKEEDKRIRDGGLYIKPEITNNWIELGMQIPDATPTIEAPISNASHPTNLWTLRLISATDTPQNLGVSHDQYIRAGEKYTTIPEYLSLQASLLQDYQPPIDQRTWSWLDGTYNDELRNAAIGLWAHKNGKVGINMMDVSYRSNYLGVHTAVS